MLHLLVDMLERVGFLIALAFVFSRSRWMRSYMSYQPDDRRYSWQFVLYFSLYAILGTYSGVTVSQYSYQPAPWIGEVSAEAAIANSRTVGVVIAGLLGGTRSGLLVGAVAGMHRYSLGGFVAVACMVAPVLQGLLAGLCRRRLQERLRSASSVKLAFAVGLASELLQMVLILLLARPLPQAAGLVSLIALPQVLANSIGVAVFFLVHHTIESEEDRIGSEQATRALQIADRIMPLWRLPFRSGAQEMTRVLHEETRAVGVVFTQDGVEWAEEGKRTPYGIPLRLQTRTEKRIGEFMLYYERMQDDNPSRRRMLSTLGQLLSHQYAFAEAERQSQLLADAEIRSLQAQMRPHFLFNVLNTLKSFIRTKPEDARQLVMHLSTFLRKNMNNSSMALVTVKDELELVTAYLNLSKARLGEQLQLYTEIDERALGCRIPSFTIQPLVENAIIHGLASLGRPGFIRITVQGSAAEGEQGVRVTVQDNGIGMQRAQSRQGASSEHAGLALSNIEQRLSYHYGTNRPLHIESEPGRGTSVTFWIREPRSGAASDSRNR